MPALRVHHGKGGVIADGADVAEVIGEPFELAHERAQPHRASRHVDAVRSLDRPGESERVGHGAVAGHPPRKHRGTFDGRAFHQPLDALVHVTKSRLEANDRLAVRGETEMPGLDDARVHGTHRNLVQALAFGRQEDVALCSARRSADYPFPVVEPGARIGQPFGFQPPQISDRALEANGRRMRLPDRRKALVFALDAEHAEFAFVGQRHVDLLALGPETEQRPLPV